MRQLAYKLPIKSDHEFPVAGRDLHVTGPSLVEKGIHREKKRNVWLHYGKIPDPPVGSTVCEWNRQMYFNKAGEPTVAFYSAWKDTACSSHSSHVLLLMTDMSNEKESLVKRILKRWLQQPSPARIVLGIKDWSLGEASTICLHQHAFSCLNCFLSH